MPTFHEYSDVVFIAGKNFQSEYGTHMAGTEVEQAAKFPNLQVLIDNNFVYPIAPSAGYNYLPPHLFSSINVKDEVMAKLRGAMNPNPDHFQDGKKPESMLLAEREAQQKLTEMNADTKEGQKAAQEARDEAVKQYQALQTVDANPAAQTKSAGVKKMYKGDQEAWEIIEAQGDQVQKDKDAKPPKDTEKPVNLREDDKKSQTKTPDDENPDKAASKEPVEETKAPADPVGKQPSNATPGGSRTKGK